jgi:hypothetical protein
MRKLKVRMPNIQSAINSAKYAATSNQANRCSLPSQFFQRTRRRSRSTECVTPVQKEGAVKAGQPEEGARFT